MNWLATLQRLALDVSRAVGPNAREAHRMSPPETPEQTNQLDRLLAEIRENEQQLGSEHWAAMASAFQKAQDAAPTRKTRYRLRGTASQLLPLGGLLALAGLTLSQMTRPVAADGAAETQSSESAEVAIDLRVNAEANATHADNAPANPATATVEPFTSLGPTPSSNGAATPTRRTTHRAATLRSSNAVPSAATPTAAAPIAAAIPVAPTSASAFAAQSKAAAVEPDTFATQLAALKRADKALKAGRLSEARSALDRDFSSQLEPHAAALRTTLACQSGALSSGRRSLAAQERAFPSSPYLERMRRACE